MHTSIKNLVKKSNKKNMSLSDMKLLAKATSNYSALRELEKIGVKDLAEIKRYAAMYESHKPSPSADVKNPNVFGLSGKDTDISDKDNKKMWDRKPVKPTSEDSKDIRKRRKTDKFHKDTSDRKKDFSALAKPSTTKKRFSDILGRGKKSTRASALRRKQIKTSATNKEVIEMFVTDSFPKDKKPEWGTNNLKIKKNISGYTDIGWALYNYSTPILYRNNNGELFFNTQKYSRSTSAIQSTIATVLEEQGISATEVDESGMTSAIDQSIDSIPAEEHEDTYNSRARKKLSLKRSGLRKTRGSYYSDQFNSLDITSEYPANIKIVDGEGNSTKSIDLNSKSIQDLKTFLDAYLAESAYINSSASRKKGAEQKLPREISPKELADLSEFWENSKIDTSKYYDPIVQAWEVDKDMYEKFKNEGNKVQERDGRFYVMAKKRIKSGKKPGVQDGTGPWHMDGDNPRAGAGKGNCEKDKKDKKAKTVILAQVQPGQQVGISDPTTGETKNIVIDETAMSPEGTTSYIGTDESGNKVTIPEGTEVTIPEEVTASTVLSKIRKIVGMNGYE